MIFRLPSALGIDLPCFERMHIEYDQSHSGHVDPRADTNMS